MFIILQPSNTKTTKIQLLCYKYFRNVSMLAIIQNVTQIPAEKMFFEYIFNQYMPILHDGVYFTPSQLVFPGVLKRILCSVIRECDWNTNQWNILDGSWQIAYDAKSECGGMAYMTYSVEDIGGWTYEQFI